jgi:alkanesulfonate monooxygenase SsuD/methylene tetrahydromethanopterin reductase-like flavin-dependent oxidoreductase (luciferase family)
MKFAIDAPHFGPYADARVLAGLARDAEHAGWDGFFIWDHVMFENPTPVVDTTVALTAIAMNTERIRFGAMITPLARRRPTKFARETVSLDRLSNGRLIVGVGLGIVKEEFEGFGEVSDFKTRAAMLDEGLEVLTRLWSGAQITHRGARYTVENAMFTPTPVQQPRIPIWVAGTWANKAPFKRAARWDGVVPLWEQQRFDNMMPAEMVKEMVAYVKSQRTSHAPFDVTHWGILPQKESERASVVAEYADAGVTWWRENLSPWAFGWDNKGDWALERMRAKILQGPPK